MVTRMVFTDVTVAQCAADAIDDAGYEVALITERVDDAESYLVATPATAAQIKHLVPASAVLDDDSYAPDFELGHDPAKEKKESE